MLETEIYLPVDSTRHTEMLKQLAIDGRDIGRLMAVHHLQLIAARYLGNAKTFAVLMDAIEEIRDLDVTNA